jgi:hypothetical protein
LYVNRQFTTRIVGLKREESGAFDHCEECVNRVLIDTWGIRDYLEVPLRPYR